MFNILYNLKQYAIVKNIYTLHLREIDVLYFINMYFSQIVLMVVGTDSVHMKEYSHVHQKLTENFQDSDIIYSPGMFHNLFYNL